MATEAAIAVEVVYALPDEQCAIEVKLAPGTTVADAIRLSGLLDRYPQIDLETAQTGLHGRLVRADTVLSDGDRVEIYRPLLADPKQARRRRVLPRR